MPKNKCIPITQKIKSYYEKRIRGLQKSKNHQKIQARSGCYGLTAQKSGRTEKIMNIPFNVTFKKYSVPMCNVSWRNASRPPLCTKL